MIDDETATTNAEHAARTPLYKYVTIQVLRSILEGSIRFTQPSAFNDPFELLPEVVVPNDEPERQFKCSFDLLASRDPQRDRSLQVIPDGCGSSDIMSRHIVGRLNQLIGILCLSKKRDSLRMWAHYADQYAGAVIEFDGSHEFFVGQIEVEYLSERPRRHLNSYLDGVRIPISELCAKSNEWADEDEVRIIRPLSQCKIIAEDPPRKFPVFVKQIPLEAIKCVILGERTSVADQREIYNCLRDTSIELALAAVHNAGFTFREERIKYGVPISKMGPSMSPRTAHIFSDQNNARAEFAHWMLNNHPMSKIVNVPV
jgi:hypothetical protein